jgi:hypothetical protein
LFELFDRLEEVAKFFDAGEGFVGGNFTSLECSTCLSDQLAKRIDNLQVAEDLTVL